jgi:hypothetical protein
MSQREKQAELLKKKRYEEEPDGPVRTEQDEWEEYQHKKALGNKK